MATDLQKKAQEAFKAAQKDLSKGKSPLEKKAWAYAFAAGQMGLMKVAGNEKAQQILAAANSGMGAAKQMAGVYERLEKGEIKADAAGIIAVSSALNAGISAVAGIGVALGLPPNVAKEVNDWSNVALGCAAGAAANPIYGGIACAFQFLGKVLSFIKGTPPPEVFKPHEPRAFLMGEGPTVELAMATDATRLASALHHFYGIQSYQHIFDKLAALESLQPAIQSTRYLHNEAYPRQVSPSKNTPAIDMRVLLYLLDTSNRTPQQAWQNISDGLMMISLTRGSYARGVNGRWPFLRFNWDGDLPFWAISQGAAHGRAAVANKGATKAAHLVPWDNNAREAARRWYSPQRPLQLMPRSIVEVDWAPFVRAEELCTLFGATTIRENQIGADLMRAYTEAGLPVRWRVVRDDDRTGDLRRSGGLSKQYYSNYPTRDGSTVRLSVDDMVSGAVRGDPTSALELGLVRLVGAASFLQLQFVLNRRRGGYAPMDLADVDLIKQLKKFSAGPEFAEIEAPADPRQVYQNQLTPLGRLATPDQRVSLLFKHIVAREQATKAALEAGAAAARVATMKALVMQQPSVWGQSVAGMRPTPSQLLKAGLQTKDAAANACLAAGGVYYSCVGGHVVCGKPGEGAALACKRFGRKAPPPPSLPAQAPAGTSPASPNTLLLVGAAAVGALLLVRR